MVAPTSERVHIVEGPERGGVPQEGCFPKIERAIYPMQVNDLSGEAFSIEDGVPIPHLGEEGWEPWRLEDVFVDGS